MNDAPPDGVSFEAAMAELDEIVRQLEDGSVGLEEALARYERGVGLLKQCYGRLRHAEQRILLLTGEDGEGRPLTRPFEHAPSLEATQGDGKRRRKSEDRG
jgi:exodeoxyribonuclease VII small subunit